MVTILCVAGSLRLQSSNTRLLKALCGLMPASYQCQLYTEIGLLPHFDPGLDIPDKEAVLPAVANWRSQLAGADIVLIGSPEYAHGPPGTLKNALDWIVSSGEFVDKPTGVITASPSPTGGDKANAALCLTLEMMLAHIPAGARLCISGVSAKVSDDCQLTDVETQMALLQVIETLVAIVDSE